MRASGVRNRDPADGAVGLCACAQAWAASISGPVALGPLGLAGDEQADLSVHGGLSKAVYALPQAHLAWWQAQRQARGVSLFEEVLAPGALGENLSVQGVSEDEVFIGDTWHFADLVLRVSEPRQPCGKFNAVMGYEQAGRDMVHSGRCGFYLAVDTPGTLTAGENFVVQAVERATSVAAALRHKAWKHLR